MRPLELVVLAGASSMELLVAWHWLPSHSLPWLCAPVLPSPVFPSSGCMQIPSPEVLVLPRAHPNQHGAHSFWQLLQPFLPTKKTAEAAASGVAAASGAAEAGDLEA